MTFDAAAFRSPTFVIAMLQLQATGQAKAITFSHGYIKFTLKWLFLLGFRLERRCLVHHAKSCDQWILSKDLFCLSILSCLLQVPDASSLMCLFHRPNSVFKDPYSTHLKNHGLRMQGHHIYGMKQCKVQEIMS